MGTQWEPHDLDRITSIVDDLKEMGVRDVMITGALPTVVVQPETLIHVASLTHRRPTVDEHMLPNLLFLTDLTFSGHFRLLAYCSTADLEELGYRVTTRVVPIEEATQDANRT